ncbi:MAG TPA: ribosome maturation factor RimM [Burkholderiaceae bacterium]|nr:ribosome maturation factor RimM [Burkholderiaceae bacterium]
MGDPPDWPQDAVEVGAVVGAWGIRGALKIKTHAADPQALLTSRHWFLERAAGAPGDRAAVRLRFEVIDVRMQAEGVVAQVRGVTDRDGAEALRGARIHLSRAAFPATGLDEFYWVDLIGLSVFNRDQHPLGTVRGLMDTGAHSILRVASEGAADLKAERLIPFVDAYVDSVDLSARRIDVDWGLDY